jgi:hypothetical protein
MSFQIINQSIIVWTFDSILQTTNKDVSFRRKPESSLLKGLWMPDQVRHDEVRIRRDPVMSILLWTHY